jgi:uncharacterized protein (DUF2267 family)
VQEQVQTQAYPVQEGVLRDLMEKFQAKMKPVGEVPQTPVEQVQAMFPMILRRLLQQEIITQNNLHQARQMAASAEADLRSLTKAIELVQKASTYVLDDDLQAPELELILDQLGTQLFTTEANFENKIMMNQQQSLSSMAQVQNAWYQSQGMQVLCATLQQMQTMIQGGKASGMLSLMRWFH